MVFYECQGMPILPIRDNLTIVCVMFLIDLNLMMAIVVTPLFF
jgi:hypothetical protein